MSRSVRMLALTFLGACRVQAPAKPCGDVMLGACAEPTVALTPCERGRARNLDDGACLTTRETRDLTRSLGVYVDENDTIVCEAKTDDLVASARLHRIACAASGARPPPCPPRTIRSAGTCTPLDRSGTVDVASWSRAAAAEVCDGVLSRSPIGVSASELELTVELAVSIPNNDLSQSFVRLRTKPPVPEEDLASFSGRLVDALRRLGAENEHRASASDVSAAAICRVSTRRPISVP